MPSAIDLITLDQAKAAVTAVGKAIAPEANGVLDSLVTEASDWFNRQTGRILARTTYTARRVIGDGRPCLVFEWPIELTQPITILVNGTAQSVWKPGDAGDPVNSDVEIVEYSQQGPKDLIRRAGWTKRPALIQITLTAGYSLSGAANQHPVPRVLQDGVIILVRDMFRLVDRQNQGIASISMQGQATTFDSLEIPKRVYQIADMFTRAEMLVGL